MVKLNTIKYDADNKDYLINGKPLILHLIKHEKINPNDYLPSFLSQPGTCERLLGKSKPDLVGGFVAIYLCSFCGDYDGNPIGLKVTVDDGYVVWSNIGIYSDFDKEFGYEFNRFYEYKFKIEDYKNFIENIKVYEPA